jgi:hypothetical protein
MRPLPRSPARNLEEHGVINVEAGQRVEGRRRQKDLVTAFQMSLVLKDKGVRIIFLIEDLRQP